MAKDSKGITVRKEDDSAEWYSQVVQKAELADYAPVKGCMIIRPYGYAIWENIQKYFDARIKADGVQNAYFPLFIPEGFFKKEQEHAQGFSPEVAWIANKYEGERIAVRPTSETIMYDSYSRWVRSHRDLPIKMNQWCNVVRWETEATKMFLRTREFLWQEGHCAYATDEECTEQVMHWLEEYRKLAEEQLAIPVLTGKKTPMETFAGAKFTTTIEGLMPDGKALQCGTSHHLGQGFAKGFGITFVGEDEKEHYVHQNSWGISTRLIGALVLQHGDDKGLVLPPHVAPIQVVMVPIIFEDSKKALMEKVCELSGQLSGLRVHVDDREGYSAGWKFSEWELKGVPLRVEIGPKDLDKGHVVVVRRDTGEKTFVPFAEVEETIPRMLQQVHDSMYAKAKENLDAKTIEISSKEELLKVVEDKGIALAPWCGETEAEEKLKEETKGISSRCIPFDKEVPAGAKCFYTGKPAVQYVYFSRSY